MTVTNKTLLNSIETMTKKSVGLTKQVTTLANELNALSDYGRRSRRFIRLLLISIVFDICLSVILGLVAYSNHNLTEKAARASSSSVVACVSANESNKTQKELWEFLFTFPLPPGETPAARTQRLKTTVQFKTYINKAFVQRACPGE